MFLFSTPSAHPENVLKPDWEHHRIEYCASSLFDLLRRYFDVVVGRDMQGFPAEGVFDRLVARNVDYAPIMNPVLCRTPIRIQNPYR